MLNMCDWTSKLHQNLIFLEYLQPEMLLLGHPGGGKWYEQRFWTARSFCDLWPQADLYIITILVTSRCWQFWNYVMDSRSFQTSLICAISHILICLSLLLIYPRSKWLAKTLVHFLFNCFLVSFCVSMLTQGTNKKTNNLYT